MLHKKKIALLGSLALVILAYIFSVGVRYYYVDLLDGQNELKFNNTLMINTNDGYFFAEGARELLSQTHLKEINQTKILSQDSFVSQAPITEPLSLYTAFLSKILPFSFEQIMLYMPGFVASLVVIPLFLLARSVMGGASGNLAAFFSACIGGIAVSYYNRTMFGYYDTDMFIILYAMSVGALLYYGSKIGEGLNDTDKLKLSHILVLFFTPFLTYMAYWYYPSLRYVLYGYFLILIVYNLSFGRNNYFLHILSTLFGASLLIYVAFSRLSIAKFFSDPTSTSLDLGAIYANFIALFFVSVVSILYIIYCYKNLTSDSVTFNFKKPKSINFHLFIFFCISVTFIFFIGVDTFGSLGDSKYISKQGVDDEMAYFYGTINTIAEVSNIDFNVFAKRISGGSVAFLLTLLGIIILVIKDRKFLIFAPLLVLGYFAYFRGLRYTIYAVPIHALGFAGLIFGIKYIFDRFTKSKIIPFGIICLVLIIGGAFLKPNLEHIKGYITQPVFNTYEVNALSKLKSISKRGDYVLAWWDYGYPIRYYSALNTFTDGGAHSGAQNYHVSLALTHPNPIVALNAINLFSMHSNVIDVSKLYRLENTKDFLDFISKPLIYTKKSRHDTYIYLPYRMFEIFPVVSKFSEIRLESGDFEAQKLFLMKNNIKDDGNRFILDDDISIYKDNLMLNISPTQSTPLNAFVLVVTEQDGKNNIQMVQGDPTSKYAAIYLKSYNMMIVAHLDYINSTFIRGFVFENLDGNFYELVDRNPFVKIYKVKNTALLQPIK